MIDPQEMMKKDTLTFMAMFFWILVRHQILPTKVYNVLIWDRAVMIVAKVEGLDIKFSKLIVEVIHKRELMTSTTYPFPWLIPQLCRDARVPIWNYDRLRRPAGTLDIRFI